MSSVKLNKQVSPLKPIQPVQAYQVPDTSFKDNLLQKVRYAPSLLTDAERQAIADLSRSDQNFVKQLRQISNPHPSQPQLPQQQSTIHQNNPHQPQYPTKHVQQSPKPVIPLRSQSIVKILKRSIPQPLMNSLPNQKHNYNKKLVDTRTPLQKIDILQNSVASIELKLQTDVNLKESEQNELIRKKFEMQNEIDELISGMKEKKVAKTDSLDDIDDDVINALK
ncbi:Hypothetical_protein [Hexamita inflata]|uniref:Hypothetical_protein n=1 Tax=Hexamita inflata TaxID=28002 RepID=A0AA86RC25_9EUKA|nr:Hypothetical protein HINF_LOCUS59533 [Hexamita inflata]